MTANNTAYSWKIVHKRERWIAASGFYSLARAEAWLQAFNPALWMNKTLQVSDFEIIPE